MIAAAGVVAACALLQWRLHVREVLFDPSIVKVRRMELMPATECPVSFESSYKKKERNLTLAPAVRSAPLPRGSDSCIPLGS